MKPFKENRVMLADSYKYSQQVGQYRPDMEGMFDYLESRGGVFPATLFQGLQTILLKYLDKPIKMWEVREARDYAKAHGVSFNYKGWKRIVKKHKGKLPVKIKAVKEGLLVPTGNVLMTVESTDKKIPWVVGWLETLLMKVWYPTTVATKVFYTGQVLKKWMRAHSDNTDVSFMFHNFGDRATSCPEQSAIGGMAASVTMLGTDNFNSLRYARYFYDADISGYSINATEHSSVTSWTKDKELNMINYFLESNKKKDIIACVMDSYDIYKSVNEVTSGDFKDKIESDEYPIFVIRPDSGDPEEVVGKLLDIIDKNGVKSSINSKKLVVMDKYRIIWGDGIDVETIEKILQVAVERGFAPDNFAFGSGGDIMQKVNRDTQKFAIKCSEITVSEENYGHNGEDLGIVTFGVDVFKDPITDPGKKSKAGKLELVMREGDYLTVRKEDVLDSDTLMLETVWKNGKLIRKLKWDDIVSLAASQGS